MLHPFLALDVWTDPVRKAVDLTRAWERFLSGDPAPRAARPSVVGSWQRCRAQGVDPRQSRAPIPLSPAELREQWEAHPLAAYLEPLVNQLATLAAGSGHLVVVTDAAGHILRLVGDRGVQRAADHMNFVPGSQWTEASAGTNAIGTALVERHPIQVFAAEHFCAPVHYWTCSAAPVLDPLAGEPLAVIDMTGLRETVHPHTLTAVAATAQAVEDQLRIDINKEHLHLAEHFLAAAGRQPRADLAVVDRSGRVVRCSPGFSAGGWLDGDGRLVGLPPANTQPQYWEQEGPRGIRRFELNPVHMGTRVVGALVQMVAPAAGVSGRGTAGTAPAARCSFAGLVGAAPPFQEALATAARFAPLDLPVLIQGESGTGKDLLAQAIHTASHRAMGPFIAVNCGAIPRDLVASEFFGYEAGTFTGAAREGRPGKFELACGGTIFLDEIGEMPLEAQVSLLRVLEHGEVLRLGGRQPVRVDVRVVAATNRELAAAVQAGAFREDLYYRLCVLSVRMPPLRERAEDVPILLEHFLRGVCRDTGRGVLRLSDAALAALKAYHWPGNVRELRNVAIRLALTTRCAVVAYDDLPPEVHRAAEAPAGPAPDPAPGPALAPTPDLALAPTPDPALDPASRETRPLPELERAAFAQAWLRYGGQASAVAAALGISRATTYRKARQFGLLAGAEESRSS